MKKGFTLIELLAVIIILGVIALIATPVVLNIVDDSKKSANLSSAKLYIKAANNSIINSRLNGNYKIDDGTYTINSSGNICLDANCTQTLEVQANGKKPTSGTLGVLNEEVVCIGTELVFSDYTLTCSNNGEYVLKNDSDSNNGSENSGEGGNNSGQGSESPEVTQNQFGPCTYVNNDSDTKITVGDKVTCGTESFYVIEDLGQGTTVKMLSEWNLNVKEEGNSNSILYPDASVGYQNENVKGNVLGGTSYGTVKFDSTPNREYGYWTTGDNHDLNTSVYTDNNNGDYPAYVYDNNATIKSFVDDYVGYLNSAISGANAQGRLIKYEELTDLGCPVGVGLCSSALSWVYQTSYWTGSAKNSGRIFYVFYSGSVPDIKFDSDSKLGVRPVIEISSSVIQLAS